VEILRQLDDKRADRQLDTRAQRPRDERTANPSEYISAALNIGIKAGGFSVGEVGDMKGCPWRDQIVNVTSLKPVNPFRQNRALGSR